MPDVTQTLTAYRRRPEEVSETASGPPRCPRTLTVRYRSVLNGQIVVFYGSQSDADAAPPESDGGRHRCALLPQRLLLSAADGGLAH